MKNFSGFTLLEVLIALAILSAVSLTVIRAVGDGMVQIGGSAWRDTAIRLGRNQLIKLGQQDLKGNLQGTFAPDYPRMSWRARLVSLGDAPGKKLELTVREDNREVLLEQIIFP